MRSSTRLDRTSLLRRPFMQPGTQPTRRGFTLIELLLVMVILAVLAAVVVPNFVNRSKDVRVKAAQADISNMETCLDAFEVDCGRYPTTSEGLAVLLQAPANLKGWQGPYLKKGVPTDPWGNSYNYRYPGQHNTNGYDLFSGGPDGQEGTADDIVNWQQQN